MQITKLEPESWPLEYVKAGDDMSVYHVICRVDGKSYYQIFNITKECESDADIDLDEYLTWWMTDLMKRKYGKTN